MVDSEHVQPGNQTPNLEELQDKLDNLWESYLHFLDEYDQAQKQLNKHISKGFFSLAQANFKSSSRTRYGQDYYDDRMQSSRRVRFERDDENADGRPVLSITPNRTAVEVEKDPKTEREDASSEKQHPTPPSTPPAEDAKPPPDPLRWFGILVPPALRACQSSFVSAVEGPVAQASNASRSMRGVEVEIRRVRKEIRRSERTVKERG